MSAEERGPQRPGSQSGAEVDDLLAAARRWDADSAAAGAAASRSRARWLRTRAEEDATLIGLLVDLAERDEPVVLRTSGGRSLQGRVAAAGRDFVVLARQRPPATSVVPVPAVTSLRPAPEGAPRVPTGSRAARAAGTFAGVVAGLAGERRRVSVVLSGGDELRGELRSAGQDLVTLRTGGPHPSVVYVALGSVTELSLLGSG